jgi:hypothetical protein
VWNFVECAAAVLAAELRGDRGGLSVMCSVTSVEERKSWGKLTGWLVCQGGWWGFREVFTSLNYGTCLTISVKKLCIRNLSWMIRKDFTNYKFLNKWEKPHLFVRRWPVIWLTVLQQRNCSYPFKWLAFISKCILEVLRATDEFRCLSICHSVESVC